MKKIHFVMCCAMLASMAAVVIPSHARAATQEDKDFLTTASQANVDEITLSQLAETKATDPAVQQFAHRMVVDHTKLGENMKPFADAWGLTPPAGVDEDHQKALDKLNGLSGKDFDKQYMDDMMTDHTKAYDLFSKEVKDTHDAKFKVAVEQGKSVVAAHKNMAWDLKKKL